jgi:hypothetical protein
VAYDYFRDRFSVEANDPVQQDEQVRYKSMFSGCPGPSTALCSGHSGSCTPLRYSAAPVSLTVCLGLGGCTFATAGVVNPQAFITYGRQGNDRLLQFYGSVEADNPADAYVVCNLDSAIEVAASRLICHDGTGQSWHRTTLPAMLKGTYIISTEMPAAGPRAI